MAKKTNAARILDSLGIAYELREYEVDPDDLSAPNVAAKIGLPLPQVYKTLIVRGDRNGPCFAVAPGNRELDLKRLAKASGDRKVEPAPLSEVESLTGYIRGGVTVLGAKKAFRTFVDASIEQHPIVAVSAGIRGTQILISPVDYLLAVKGILASICSE